MKIKSSMIPPSEPEYVFTISMGHREFRKLQLVFTSTVQQSKAHNHLPDDCPFCILHQSLLSVKLYKNERD